jgi:hypothetical protein
MKNLTLQSVSTVDIGLGPAAADDDPISHFCLDSTEGLLYAVTRSGLVLCLAQAGKKVLFDKQIALVTICSSQMHECSSVSIPVIYASAAVTSYACLPKITFAAAAAAPSSCRITGHTVEVNNRNQQLPVHTMHARFPLHHTSAFK